MDAKKICEFSGKICYSRRNSGEIINSQKRHRYGDHLGHNKKIIKRCYYCTFCGCYHLTHVPFFKKGDFKRMMKFYEADF
ncbi:hypothetical protein TRSA_09870 [Treponema saccharophilum]|uniref:Uncharacterized protein n=1 Tax=Treponema saccharophilum DSM 2985 TaxID=907348 RepID=H7EMN8_9SPIR|nr:hypothetical protein TresaDRAFT_0271 [Treponema saccharophilum DSM 2985]BDC95888.1 hypothetical protein TRSA_09870 [Treponema saccharophilum]